MRVSVIRIGSKVVFEKLEQDILRCISAKSQDVCGFVHIFTYIRISRDLYVVDMFCVCVCVCVRACVRACVLYVCVHLLTHLTSSEDSWRTVFLLPFENSTCL